ncbi:MAG: hypothetical protein KDD61_15940 [Bdellovibrionales bacterium]|nr:hypothetical protein [Bdellovibrionales bacterium]
MVKTISQYMKYFFFRKKVWAMALFMALLILSVFVVSSGYLSIPLIYTIF